VCANHKEAAAFQYDSALEKAVGEAAYAYGASVESESVARLTLQTGPRRRSSTSKGKGVGGGGSPRTVSEVNVGGGGTRCGRIALPMELLRCMLNTKDPNSQEQAMECYKDAVRMLVDMSIQQIKVGILRTVVNGDLSINKWVETPSNFHVSNFGHISYSRMFLEWVSDGPETYSSTADFYNEAVKFVIQMTRIHHKVVLLRARLAKDSEGWLLMCNMRCSK
jgi:hypothetical protein